MATPHSDPALQQLLQQLRPADASAGRFLSLPGLSGNSVKITFPDRVWVARSRPQPDLPFVDRLREYRILKKLARYGLTPAPLAANRQWLIVPWQQGETYSPQRLSADYRQVSAALWRLHRLPLTGYRISLSALLERYWQQCQQRNYRGFRYWQRLRRHGEPRPLRLVPLHMDLHAGNLIYTEQGISVIDWEYAADGDIALDLAALTLNDPEHQERWLEHYAQLSGIAPARLRQQVRRWQPWLQLLAASWYQLRAEQSADPQLCALARDSWQTLTF